MVWPTLGSRTAKEQDRTEPPVLSTLSASLTGAGAERRGAAQSNFKIAFYISKLISKSIFVNLPTQELQKITEAVVSDASMYHRANQTASVGEPVRFVTG